MTTKKLIDTGVQLGDFIFVLNFAILQVGPQSGMIFDSGTTHQLLGQKLDNNHWITMECD